jgi:hypothetical protein
MDEYEKQITESVYKFLKTYNKVIDEDDRIPDLYFDYKTLIRHVGKYIYKDFTKENWLNTSLFINIITIDMSVFRNTIYEKKVENFLISLKDAFFSDMSEKVFEYLDTIKDDQTRELCINYYTRVRNHSNKIREIIYSNENIEPESEEFKKLLLQTNEYKDFNNFLAKEVSPYDDKVLIIENLCLQIKNILISGKRKERVYFEE